MRLYIFSGEWGECTHQTCGDGGVQSREAWCSHSTGWATIEANCDANLRPTTYQRCFYVCDYHQYQYLWNTSDWSRCVPRDVKSVDLQRSYHNAPAHVTQRNKFQ